jgi:hypothetical protein
VPTEPLESILYRDLSKVQAKPIIEIASPLLQELVNYSTNALVRCATSATGGVDEDIAVLALYRHIIEMTDAIEVLISQSCATPAIPLVRSSFEALLSMEYILESDQHYVRRSLSWLVCYVHERLDMYERLDSSTTKGDEFKRSLASDTIASSVELPAVARIRELQQNLQVLLAKPHLEPIESAFKSHKRRPKWYQLFSGPSNLRELARHMNRSAQYDFLYRDWSRIVHARDALSFIARGRLRDSSEIKTVTNFVRYFLFEATRMVLAKFRPGENIGPWYIREVEPYALALRDVPDMR